MPLGTESVSEKISKEYYGLTAAEKKTADYVLTHQQQTQFMSISELAEVSGVAEATVSRFCRNLGYKGYNAFKLALAQSLAYQRGPGGLSPDQVSAAESPEDIRLALYNSCVSALEQTMGLVDPQTVIRAVDLMEAAGKVLCMGQGGSMLIAQEAAHLFSSVSGKFFAIADSHMQVMAAANMAPGDVLLFFSYSGASKDMMDTLTVAGKQGAQRILVTRFPKSPGAELADLVLQCGSDESPLQLGSVQAKIAQIYVTDLLLSEFCRRNTDECNRKRNQVAQALADKHV